MRSKRLILKRFSVYCMRRRHGHWQGKGRGRFHAVTPTGSASRLPPITLLPPQTLRRGPPPGPFGISGEPIMTKRNTKSRKSTVKVAAAKTPVTKSSVVAAASPPLIVLGFDEQQKPRGARFVDGKPDLVIKAADLMGFKVYQANLSDVAEVAKKLPLGRLYANGRGFVPNIRQSLYTEVVAALALEPQTALTKNGDKDGLPAARGLPRSWDDIATGHLVIAQEAL